VRGKTAVSEAVPRSVQILLSSASFCPDKFRAYTAQNDQNRVILDKNLIQNLK